MVAAVEAVTRRKAMVVGKPSDILREYILRHVLGELMFLAAVGVRQRSRGSGWKVQA